MPFDESWFARQGWVEEPGVAVVGFVAGEQAGSVPGLDRGGMDAQGVGDLGDGELAGGAQPVMSAGQVTVAA